MPTKPPPRKRPSAAAKTWDTLVRLNPVKTAVAAVVTIATLLGALPAWWAVEDHFYLRREAEKARQEAKEDVADVSLRLEINRLWAEYSRLDQNRQRLEKAIRDTGFRQALGSRLSPADKLSLAADQADLATVQQAMAETKRAINALRKGP